MSDHTERHIPEPVPGTRLEPQGELNRRVDKTILQMNLTEIMNLLEEVAKQFIKQAKNVVGGKGLG